MKLTKQKLYKLIVETMEQRYFGSGIQQIIQSKNTIHKNGPFLNSAWLTNNIGPRLGAGYSREVYALEVDAPPVEDLVVKFVIGTPKDQQEGVESNRLEVEQFNKHPSVFPKTYIQDPSPNGPEWIVVEKVDVIESGPELAEVVINSFPSVKGANDIITDAGFARTSPMWIFDRLLDAFEEAEPEGSFDSWVATLHHSRAARGVSEQAVLRAAEYAWDIVTNDVNLMTFISTCKNLGVDFEEIREGNVATNSERNKLLLIDISIWNS